MKYQMKHQNTKTGETILCFEFEAVNDAQFEKAVKKAWREYIPPEGHVFIVCNEHSKHFEPVNQVA